MVSNGACVSPIKNLSCVQDFEDRALQHLPKKVGNYYAHGVGSESTLDNNKLAFKKFRIRPRVMVDVSKRSLETTILGERVAFPVGVSPWAVHKMAHPDGGIATAQAAGEMNTIFIQSTLSSTSIEEVAAAAPMTIKNITRGLVERAERSGFKAIVLTVDAPEPSKRRYIDGDSTPPFPMHLKFVNLENEKCPETDKVGTDELAKNYDLKGAFNTTQTWNDVKWLKSITKLPIVLKGILTKEDALIGVDLGADAMRHCTFTTHLGNLMRPRQCGAAFVKNIQKSMVVHESYYNALL